VVEHATSIEITTDDNKTYAARLVGADPQTDPALLKVEADRDLASVPLAEKMPRIGDWVLTIGNPFGLGGTVTAGIVSASARNIETGSLNHFIQIDASVNQGSSGGPTFDLVGNVIGVNSAIFSPNGVSVGIGFDIPADTVKLVITQLMDKGTVSHGWLGVKILTVTNEVGQGFGIKRPQGALVVETQPNSPAANALAAGDVVTSVNGGPVKDDRELTKTIGSLAAGTSIELGVIRNGEEITVMVTLGELPRSRNEVP
jgi:serine protease Do